MVFFMIRVRVKPLAPVISILIFPLGLLGPFRSESNLFFRCSDHATTKVFSLCLFSRSIWTSRIFRHPKRWIETWVIVCRSSRWVVFSFACWLRGQTRYFTVQATIRLGWTESKASFSNLFNGRETHAGITKDIQRTGSKATPPPWWHLPQVASSLST